MKKTIKHLKLCISGIFILLVVGCETIPIPTDKITVQSKLGNEFYFFIPNTQDGFSFKEQTNSRTLTKRDLSDFIEQTACAYLKRKGYNAVPERNSSSEDATARIIFNAKHEGGDERPSGIGIIAEAQERIWRVFGFDRADLSRTSYYINLDAEMNPTAFSRSKLSSSKECYVVCYYESGIIRSEASIEYWPSFSQVESMDMSKHLSNIKEMLVPEIEKATQALLSENKTRL